MARSRHARERRIHTGPPMDAAPRHATAHHTRVGTALHPLASTGSRDTRATLRRARLWLLRHASRPARDCQPFPLDAQLSGVDHLVI